MKPKTQGERLFLLLRDELLESLGHGHLRWSNFSSFLEQVGGSPDFGAYLRGAAAIHVMRRLLRFWEAERQITGQESQYVRKVASYIRNDVFTSLGDQDIARLARAVIAAEKSCNQPISRSVRSRVVGGQQQLRCYLCSAALSPSAPEGQPGFLTLEHLWPQSVGGDSIEENLLPACSRCQDTTKDAMSWEWFNIHNVVLPPNPSANAVASVTRKGHFARHFLEAMRVSNERHLSIKEAFIFLGPMRQPVGVVATGGPTTFFDLETTS